MTKKTFSYILICVALPFLSTTRDPSAPDLIIVNGNFITMEEKSPKVEAVAILGSKISHAGASSNLIKLKGNSTKVLDLGGATVVPGLIDAHAHLLNLGLNLERLDLTNTKSYESIIDLVGKRAATSKPGDWILGRGWDQNKWPDQQFPIHHKLSAQTRTNPVFLTRIDGHAGLANERALVLSGITKATKDPEGGKIVRDADGNATGVLIDKAQGLVTRQIPPLSLIQTKAALVRASKECLRYGLTGVDDAWVDRTVMEAYKQLAEEGKLDLRVYAMIGGEGPLLDEYLAKGPQIGLGDNKLTIRSIKLVIDGAMGSRGAAFFKSYADDPSNQGLILTPEQTIQTVTERALKHGFQVCVHAIGDKANHLTLNAFEKALAAVPSARDPRLRIEHAQILTDSDIPRFSKLHIIPSMQPTHATSDMYWAEARIGTDRLKGAYVWRSLLNTGVRIAGGSDFPVEGVNPLWGLYAAVTRQDQKGWPEGGWYPHQRMTFPEALRSFTQDAAYAAFEESLKGSIRVGKLADLVVLSKDISRITPKELLTTDVLMTIVGGKVVYEKQNP